MSVFETKACARKAGLAHERLLEGAIQVAAGNFDAGLGGGVFKQRVAREGGGTSGGVTVIVFKVGGHSFFVHGFAKSDKANVSAKELKALKALAQVLTALNAERIESAVEAGELVVLGAESDGDSKAQG